MPADTRLADVVNGGPLDLNADGTVDFDDVSIAADDITFAADPDISSALSILTEQRLEQDLPAGVPPQNFIINRYFGIPENEELLDRWQRLDDRLTNIRNNRSIDGTPLDLDLFAPPVDPRNLIAARAGGVSLSSALDAVRQAQIPHYRFDAIIGRAKSAAQTVAQFGQSLATVIQNRDTAALEALGAVNERAILETGRDNLEARRRAVSASLDALKQARSGASTRHDFFDRLVNNGLNANENVALELYGTGLAFTAVAAGFNAVAAPLFLPPNIFGLADGGFQIGFSVQALGGFTSEISSGLNQGASLSSLVASHQRREDDWELQRDVASYDMQMIDGQIARSEAERDSVDAEMRNLESRIRQARRVEQFITRERFSRQDTFEWLRGRLAGLYFQAYQSAYALARDAQIAWWFERGTSQQIISQNLWDSLYQGLLAGEALLLDLERLEQAHIRRNDRRLEIRKTISLKNATLAVDANGDPIDLIAQLRNRQPITFSFSPVLFEADFPGHYLRQIKSLRLTFPVVVGAYENFNATLSQLNNHTLLTPDAAAAQDMLNLNFDHEHIRSNYRNNQLVALSRGISDAGLFQLAYGDERYLPFEGTGAVSTWRLELSPSVNDETLAGLSDVIIELDYTAFDGGTALRQGT